MRTRFAPSPTGDLHVGGAWTALASDRLARAAGGASVLRVEDIDTPRVVRGSMDRIHEDLAWLGLHFDEGPAAPIPAKTRGPYVQSERSAIYDEALAQLSAKGLVYPCDCSRTEIARVASAPHAGEEVVYPGICRDLPADREMKRAPALRIRASARVRFEDLARGWVEQDLATAVGDFVLRRGDGVYAYQLVVAVDDAAMAISHVVRADDLLMSTPRQIWLMEQLGMTPPRYAHVPMVTAADGERLAKRAGALGIRALRDRGVSAEEIRDVLGRGLGCVTGHESPASWRKEPWPVPAEWME